MAASSCGRNVPLVSEQLGRRNDQGFSECVQVELPEAETTENLPGYRAAPVSRKTSWSPHWAPCLLSSPLYVFSPFIFHYNGIFNLLFRRWQIIYSYTLKKCTFIYDNLPAIRTGGQWPWRGDPKGAGSLCDLVILAIWKLFSLYRCLIKLWLEWIALLRWAGTLPLSSRSNV